MEEDIRDAIVALIHADYPTAYPSQPIAYPNGPFDWTKLPDQFVEVEIEFQGGDQVGMSYTPKRRVRGHVYVNVYRRQGTGTKQALSVIGWFSDKLKFVQAGPAQLQAPVPDGFSKTKGFHVEHLKVNFFSVPG